ncbi:Bifunctional protein GlmU [uncultured archaeon]|nr:Bifunctional protein GlmU [uncultured archaeon]
MKREQLTITLRDDIVERVDQMVDGIRIRNRSHAIEVMLSKVFSADKVKKAVILAGGEGTRMRPFTYEMPKSLIPVQGRPLLEHIVDLCRKYDVRDIVISIGYLGNKIREYFGNGSKFGVRITYIEEKEALGTAGPLSLMRDQLTETFLMFNGDVLADIDLMDLIRYHNEKKGMATIALTHVKDPSQFGVALLEGDRILDFIEKPKKGEQTSNLINAGVYVLEPSVLDVLPKGKSMIEKDIFPILAKKGELYAYPFDRQWFDTGTPESYEKAIKEWKPLS